MFNTPFGTQTQAAYTLTDLTLAINKVPNAARYIGWIERTFGSIFTPRPITQTTFMVEQMNGVLNLLVSQPRGGPAPKNATGKRSMRNFSVPHYLLEDVILAHEVEGVRAFGTQNEAETEEMVYAWKMAEMRGKHELTREWLQTHALKGIVLDGDGTELVDLFDEFGISRKEVDFDLDDNNTDVNEKCREVVQHIEDKLLGDTMTSIGVFCARDWFNALVKHPKVQEAYRYFETTQQLSADHSKKFTFAGLTFFPHGGATTDPAGATRKFVEDGYAHAFPIGGNQTFIEAIAPGDFLETVNTLGLPFYAREARDLEFNRWRKIHTQMNVLPMCTRPEVLVRIGMDIDD